MRRIDDKITWKHRVSRANSCHARYCCKHIFTGCQCVRIRMSHPISVSIVHGKQNSHIGVMVRAAGSIGSRFRCSRRGGDHGPEHCDLRHQPGEAPHGWWVNLSRLRSSALTSKSEKRLMIRTRHRRPQVPKVGKVQGGMGAMGWVGFHSWFRVPSH